MALFVHVVAGITFPLVLLIAAGYLLRLRLAIDVATLNRLVVYVILPAFLVYHLAAPDLSLADAAATAWFTVAQFFALLGIGLLSGRLAGLPGVGRAVLGLSVAYPNAGNFGIPLVELAFGHGALPQQAVVASVLTILAIVAGVPLLAHGEAGAARILREIFRTPLVPAVLLGVALKLLDIPIPGPLAAPLQIAGDALTPVALIALGAQLAAARPLASPRGLTLGLVLRLAAAPLLTYAGARLVALPSDLTDLLVVGACTPVAVLVTIVAQEFGAKETLSLPLVIASTALSPFVATAALLLLHVS